MTNKTEQINLVAIRPRSIKKHHNNRRQLSSFILFLAVVVLVNLCPFHDEFESDDQPVATKSNSLTTHNQIQKIGLPNVSALSLANLDECLRFVKLMFTNPIKLSPRRIRFTQAEARMLGKMAKVWYIKKKIKKLSKKLKKHTIAVPVFTAIPIYEHSYYPQPHVTHVTHGMHAASSYVPSVVAAPSSSSPGSVSTGSSQQMMASSSNTNQHIVPAAYKYSPPSHHHPRHPTMYVPMHAANSHQIINAYPPSPPLYVDENGGLYGHYGNAYGRYDGGYHMW